MPRNKPPEQQKLDRIKTRQKCEHRMQKRPKMEIIFSWRDGAYPDFWLGLGSFSATPPISDFVGVGFQHLINISFTPMKQEPHVSQC